MVLTEHDKKLITSAYLAGLCELKANNMVNEYNHVVERLKSADKLTGLELAEELVSIMEYIYENIKEVM